MSIKILLAAASLSLAAVGAQAQVSMNTTGVAPDASAMLDVQDDARGVLLPRMTQAQRNAIASPATGLLIYQTNNTPGFYYNSGTPSSPSWTAISGGSGGGSGTTDYIPRFSGSGLTDSRLMDSDNGLLYNKPLSLSSPASAWFKSPQAIGNWFLHEGNSLGYSFIGAMDSTSNNKGFMMGQTNNLLDLTGNVGVIYYDPQTSKMNFGNNNSELFSIDLNSGRMGYNNIQGGHFAVNSPYDTAALFTSTSSNQIDNGILRVQYTGTSVNDHVAILGSSIPSLSSDFGIGVQGEGGWVGVLGTAGATGTGSLASTGVYGQAFTNGDAVGVVAVAGDLGTFGGTKVGLLADAQGGPTSYAGFFNGDVVVAGSLAKSGGTFKIDHPLDPDNKYLYHSFVESPEMMNIYNGNITTDANGFATVILPDYFETLNKDFRYSLTVIGSFAQAMVKEEVKGNKFVIQTNQPATKVSWMVTGVRQDPYANAHRVQPEVAKEPENRGKYLNPKEWGKPETAGIMYDMLHNLEKRKAQTRKPIPQSLPKTNREKTIMGTPVKK